MKSISGEFCIVAMREEPEEHHWSTMKSYKMHLKIMQTSKGPYLRVSHTIKENPMEDGVQWIRLPYLVGEKCYVRETWDCAPDDIADQLFFPVRYKAEDCEPFVAWRSPVTMPQWAARSFVTILSCEPVRVSEICVADLQELGYFASLMQDPCDMADQIKDKFKADWHKRHPGKDWAWRVKSGITG